MVSTGTRIEAEGEKPGGKEFEKKQEQETRSDREKQANKTGQNGGVSGVECGGESRAKKTRGEEEKKRGKKRKKSKGRSGAADKEVDDNALSTPWVPWQGAHRAAIILFYLCISARDQPALPRTVFCVHLRRQRRRLSVTTSANAGVP